MVGALFCILSLVFLSLGEAWIASPSVTQSRRVRIRSSFLNADAALTTSTSEPNSEDEDYEYEYVEYEMLQETDFAGSEWLVGTVMDNRPQKISETWVRLAVDPETGKNVAFWGDNSEGKWNWDVATQFLSVSKENITGKNIWAGVVDDYYFLQGTIRGWRFWSAAEVLGQWQAKRLGVDKEEAGEAPWFESEEEKEQEQE